MIENTTIANNHARCLRLPHLGVLPEDLIERTLHDVGGFWLDSGKAERAWSYLSLGAQPCLTRIDGLNLKLLGLDTELVTADSALKLLPEIEVGGYSTHSQSGAPPFSSGWVMVLPYDLGRNFESLPELARDDLPFPEIFMIRCDRLLAYEHASGQWWLCGMLPDDLEAQHAESYLNAYLLPIKKDRPEPAVKRCNLLKVTSTLTADRFKKRVEEALQAIAAGEIYQLNLSQRFEADWALGGLELYRRLRAISPAQYGAFVSLGAGRSVCSISPELFLQITAGQIYTRPIKGTRPRGLDSNGDRLKQTELDQSPKERAELNMIVDLERNDLGRICEFGSIRVTSAGTVEAHPTVLHRVATIEGTLKAGLTLCEVLRATFPGGSVTGAPKIRAMHLIERLEPVRRGPYCGSIGWLDDCGAMTLNLAIRTALVDEVRQKVWYQAGSGIVADSQPEQEYEESLLKTRAFLDALPGRLVE